MCRGLLVRKGESVGRELPKAVPSMFSTKSATCSVMNWNGPPCDGAAIWGPVHIAEDFHSIGSPERHLLLVRPIRLGGEDAGNICCDLRVNAICPFVPD